MDTTPSASSQPTPARPASEPAAHTIVAKTRVGQQLGKYRLVQSLAAGGFAEVYLGEHVYLNTQAAIKILHAQLTQEELAPFREEARIVARLRHPHIINVLDFDVQDEMPFIVMDYAPNGTLRQRHPRRAIVSIATVLPYITQLASALQYAHDHKLVHRDVKPENMLVGYDNEILLSDFGIAIVFQTARAEVEQNVLGTVSYMSPEQCRGQALPASDQYALATVLYEWLCGRCPFQGTITEIIAQQAYNEPPPPRTYNPHLSEAVEQVILTALAKNPERRYPTVLAFARAFEEACSQQLAVAGEPAVPRIGDSLLENYTAETVRAFSAESVIQKLQTFEREKRYSRRTVFVALGSVAALALASSGFVWLAHSRLQTSQTRAQSSATPTRTRPLGTLLLTYRSHTDAVSSVAWSPTNSHTVASASRDKTVRVWNVATGADIVSYTGHSDEVHTVAWSHDGTHLASGSSDKTVQVWPLALNVTSAIITYQGHGDIVNSVAWSPDGQSIASASNDNTVRLWMAQNGTDITAYTEHTDGVRAVMWSPDGKYIASGGNDKVVRVWPAPATPTSPPSTPDTASPTALASFDKHTAAVQTLAWSPDGRYIVSGGADNAVLIWYALIGGNPVMAYTGHSLSILSVAWSPDGALVASADYDGMVHIWRAADGVKLYVYNAYHGTDPGGARVNANSVIWSTDGTMLAVGCGDKTVQVLQA